VGFLSVTQILSFNPQYGYIPDIPYTDIPMQPITTPRQIGATLQSRRKSLDLTQQQVASKLGISQNRLSVLESRAATLTLE